MRQYVPFLTFNIFFIFIFYFPSHVVENYSWNIGIKWRELSLSVGLRSSAQLQSRHGNNRYSTLFEKFCSKTRSIFLNWWEWTLGEYWELSPEQAHKKLSELGFVSHKTLWLQTREKGKEFPPDHKEVTFSRFSSIVMMWLSSGLFHFILLTLFHSPQIVVKFVRVNEITNEFEPPVPLKVNSIFFFFSIKWKVLQQIIDFVIVFFNIPRFWVKELWEKWKMLLRKHFTFLLINSLLFGTSLIEEYQAIENNK